MEDYPVDFIPSDSTEYVFTTHIKDPEHFYVHVESQTKILDDIMEALASRYFDLGPSDRILSNKRLGSLCAAKFTDDNNWYRARITGLMKTGLIEVQFVDYGNTDYVSEDRVKSLDPDLVHYPVQCYRCSLAHVSCKQGYWTPESTIQFEDKAMDQRCEAYFSGKTQDDTYLVYMKDGEGNSLNEMFGAVGVVKKSQDPAANETAFKEVAWQKGAKVQATVSYVHSPDLFWCQDQSYTNDLLILSEELSRLHMTQDIQPLTNVKRGTICAAKFSEDDAWYRGIVQDISNDAALVYFVDYGNTESVSLGLICKLNPSMRNMPAVAAKCCLAGTGPKSGSWDQAAIDHFEELVVDKEFEMKVVDRKGDTYIVNLVDIVESTDVSSEMQSFVGTPRASGDLNSNNNQTSQANAVAGIGPALSMGSREETFLTWVDNPGDFWVQLKNFDYLVEKLSNQLQEFYAQPRPGTTTSPGAFIVAKYSEDEMWYRGLVLKEISETEVLVLFIDYGNSDIVSKTDLRQVAPAFGEVVPLAFRCALVDVKPLSEDAKVWTTDAKSFLEEMTQDGCMCEVVSETESRKLVRLSVNGKDVATELASLRVVSGVSSNKTSTCQRYTKEVTVRKSEREAVTITHVSSPQDFWCQLNKNFASVDSLMEKLDSHYSDEGGTSIRDSETGRACIAQYSEDNAWYRGKLLNTSPAGLTVQFVDYGNSEVVPANLVCEPEPRFLDLPVQAVHCSLPLSGNLSHLTGAMNGLVLEKELTMEVLDVTNGIAVVELYDGGSKISDQLKQVSQSGTSVQIGGLKPATLIPLGSTVTAFTSFVISPGKFYLQLADKEEELGALMDEISVHNAQVDGHKLLSNPQVNQACMALFSEDNSWYRGLIVSLQGPSCKVLFVDYGNEESVSTDTLRALPAEFGVVPALAYECSLEGTDGATWSEEATQFFESIVMDQELECTFVSQKSVKILISGTDVKSELTNNGFFKEQRAIVSQKPSSPLPVKPQTNGGFGNSPRKGGGGWSDSEDAEQGRSGFGSNKQGFGSRERNTQSGFGAPKEGSGSGFGSSRDEGRPGFGSRGQGSSGFGGGQNQRDSGSSAPSGELTYGDPPSGPETALLVHMDEDGTFYLQLPAMEKDILFLAKRLAGSYKNGGGPRLRDTPEKGVVCCAKFPEDGCMYRCLILDVNGGTALLRYVDYGNTAECSTRDLKLLFPDLLQYSVQAYPCKLKGLTWSVDQAEKFASATLDQNLEVTFSGSSPPFEVDVQTPNGNLLDILSGKIAFTPPQPSQSNSVPKQKGFGGGSTSPKPNAGGGFGSSKSSPQAREHSQREALPPPAPKICEQKYVVQNVPCGSVQAYITHIDENGYFYLQLEKDTSTLDSIMGQLEGLSGQHPGLATGAACAAVFSEDSAWYRAQINSVEGDRLKVTFVDYGNGDVIQRDSVKPLTSALLSNGPLAFQCQFSDIGALSEEAQTKLSAYLMEHQVTAVFGSQAPPYTVTISDAEGNDLQEVVCPSDCYKAQSRPKGVVPAGVTHIEDDGRFYVQLYADFPAILKLHKTLSEESTSSNVEKLEACEVGMACSFELDCGEWHRGQIQSVTEGSVDVFDVDTGKSSSINADSVLKLPLHFFKNAPYGYECRLKGVESWTGDLRKKFTEMTEEKILNATFYTGTAPFRVSLARSIELDLLGLSAPMPDSPVREKPTEADAPVFAEYQEVTSGLEAYISHVDPDGTFYVQTVAREEDLNVMSEKLEAALASSSTGDLSVAVVGGICCAKFTEDDAWYRAQVMDTDTDKGQANVRFVDYGNTDTLEADRLASLPEEFDLEVLPAFASKSWLSGVAELSEDAVTKLKEVVLDQVVTVETAAKVEDCEEVVINVAGTPLTDLLEVQVVKTDSSSAETSNSRETEEFADASETSTHVEAGALQNKNTNAEADEFADAVENIEQSTANERPQGEKKLDVSESISEESLMPGSRISVTVSYVASPSEFYFQLDQEQGSYNTLMDEMFEHFSSLSQGECAVPKDLAVGAVCAALYAEDECWYRVQVKNFTDGSYTIFFMDHGNTEEAQADTLRILPNQFRSLPPAAKTASLAGVRPAQEQWSAEAIDEFKAQVEEKSLLADVLSVSSDKTILRLLELGIPVHEELIKKGHGVASEEDLMINQAVQHIFSDVNDTLQDSQPEGLNGHLEECDADGIHRAKKHESTKPGHGVKIGSVANTIEELENVSVYISHARSPSLFWCQLSNCVMTLKEMSDVLVAAYSDPGNLKVAEDTKTGDLVVARSPSDGLLYRSRVLYQKPSESDQLNVSVQFIDFGTEAQIERDSLFVMVDNLFKYPAQAFRCSLENIRPPQDSWPQSPCEKFLESVQDRELSLKLVGRDQDETLLVELIDPQTNQPISSSLLEAELGIADGTAPAVKGITRCPDSSLPVDTSTFENLEITHPIMESTTMVGNTTLPTQSFSIEDGKDGKFRVYSLSLHTEYDVCNCNDELPNSFHVRLLQADAQFTSLVAEVQQYVASVTDEDPEDFVPKVNDACLVRYKESWQRATILEGAAELNWNVKLQDIGCEVIVDQREVRRLPQHLLELPSQAIPCYLAGVVSVEPEWCFGAIEFFKDRAKDGKFCMYVLEDAHKGKYGVVISDLDSSESSSVNRAMVDLGYAEVVPGSYIDIQLDMEKTLDTDMLNELEESFNEVSLMKCNADVGETDEAADMVESGEIRSYCDSYKESDISKACKKKVNPCLYQLVDITDPSYEGSKTGDGEIHKENDPPKENAFCLARDVERIEQYGCPDIEISGAEMDYLGVYGDISEESDKLGEEIDAKANEDEPETFRDEEKQTFGKDTPKTATPPKEGHSPLAKETKSIYTWKLDAQACQVEKADVKLEAQKTNEAEGDKLFTKGEEAGQEKHIENQGNEECPDIDIKTIEREDTQDSSESQKDLEETAVPEISNVKNNETSEEKYTPKDLTDAQEVHKDEEDSSSKAHSGLEMEWEDLILRQDTPQSARASSVEDKGKEIELKIVGSEESSSELSPFETVDSIGIQTPQISPEGVVGSIFLDKNLQVDADLLKQTSSSIGKSVAELRKCYMSSTPSRDVKVTKSQRKVKLGHVTSSRSADKMLFTDSGGATIKVRSPSQGDPKSPRLTNTRPGAELAPVKTRKNREALHKEIDGQGTHKPQKQDVKSEYQNSLELSCEADAVGTPCSVLVSEFEGGSQEQSPEPKEEQSESEATHFISCLESDDSRGSSRDQNRTGDSHPTEPDNDIQVVEKEAAHHEEPSKEEDRASLENTSCDNTYDEYESCSETGPEDGENLDFFNSVDAIRGSIISENLSSLSIASEAGEDTERAEEIFCETSQDTEREDSCDPISLLLSGSSFDTSAVTSDTASTLERGDEDQNWMSSQLEGDSYLKALLEQPRTQTATESSSSSSCNTSCELSASATNNVSVALESGEECEGEVKPSQDIISPETTQHSHLLSQDVHLEELKADDSTSSGVSAEDGLPGVARKDIGSLTTEKISTENRVAGVNGKVSGSLTAQKVTEDGVALKVLSHDSREVDEKTEHIPISHLVSKECKSDKCLGSKDTAVRVGGAGYLSSEAFAAPGGRDGFPTGDGTPIERKIDIHHQSVTIADGDVKEFSKNVPAKEITVEVLPSEDSTEEEVRTEDLYCKNFVQREARTACISGESGATEGEKNEDHPDGESVEGGKTEDHVEIFLVEGGRRTEDLSEIFLMEGERRIEDLSEIVAMEGERSEDLSEIVAVRERGIEDLFDIHVVEGERGIKDLSEIVAVEGERTKDCRDQRYSSCVLKDRYMEELNTEERIEDCHVGRNIQCAKEMKTQVLQQSKQFGARQSQEVLSCGVMNKDEDDDDDAYYEDSQSKNESEVTELCADEEVLAGAPALDLTDGTADENVVATKGDLELDQKTERSESEPKDSSTDAEESQC